MNILLPLTSDDIKVANLSSLDSVHSWGLVNLHEGKIVKVDFCKDYQEVKELVDCVVVSNKNEYIWPFVEEGIPVLEAPMQKSIDEVIEAFLFKELYEIN